MDDTLAVMYFFFSSRRRHTRLQGDWSSDVCSSDLKRIVTAMQQPVFKIWGHALGRLIQRRPPFECDVERILDVIAESRAAIEVNGDPWRLDMEPRWIRAARKRKIKFVISVDAHSTGALNNLKYGVAMARRGWLRKTEVLNTLGTRAFINAVRPT